MPLTRKLSAEDAVAAYDALMANDALATEPEVDASSIIDCVPSSFLKYDLPS